MTKKLAAQPWQGATAGEPKTNRVSWGLRGLVSELSRRPGRIGPDWQQEEIIFRGLLIGLSSSTGPRVTVDQTIRPRLDKKIGRSAEAREPQPANQG